MANEKLVKLLDTHKNEIAEAAAQKVQTLKLVSYTTFSFAQLIERFSIPINLFKTYLETSETGMWRQYITESTEIWLNAGLPIEEFSQTVDIFIEVVNGVATREFVGEDGLKNRERVEQRLESIRTLTASTLLAARMKKGNL